MLKNTIVKLGISVLLLSMIAFGCDSVSTPDISERDQEIEIAEPGTIIEGSYIVVFEPAEKGKTVDQLEIETMRSELFAKADISSERVIANYNTAIHGFSANLSDEQVRVLGTDSRVAYIEPDRIVALSPPCGTPRGGPCDPDDGDGDNGDGDNGDGDNGDGDNGDGDNGDGDNGDGDNGDDNGDNGDSGDAIVPWGIDRVGGAVNYTGNRVSWVIDTGIQLDHPDLNVDASRGFSAFTRGPDTGVDDRNGHGTHVAGTIGAFNNIVGVASGVEQVPVKVLDRRGSGSISGVIAGVDHVAANASAGDVANMSLGGGSSQALDDAVVAAANQGILFAIAAGNSGTWASSSSPARVDHPNTWTVAATDVNDNFASFSNYGPPTSFAAPGVSVNSTWINSGYRSISGTSMSAPHVAGILLVNNGNVGSDGQSSTAPDGQNYPIASHN